MKKSKSGVFALLLSIFLSWGLAKQSLAAAGSSETYTDEDGEIIPMTRDEVVPDFALEGRNVNGVSLISFDLVSGLNLSIGPVIFYNGDRGRQIINLCKDEQKWTPPYLLNTQDCEYGYRVVEMRSKDVGVGVEVSVSPASMGLSFFGVSAGIVPIRGQLVKSERKAHSLVEAKTLPRVKIPNRAGDLDSWETGDHLSYQSYGGIITYGMLNATFIFNLGEIFLATGTWKVDITKVGPQQVWVQLTKSKLKGMSTFIGNTLTNLSLSKFKNWDDRYSFILDLADPVGVSAFEGMIRGNLRVAQEVVSKKTSLAVKPISKEHATSIYRNRKFQSSFPMVFRITRNQGTIMRNSEIFNYSNNDQVEAHYGIYLKNYYRSITPSLLNRSIKHHKSSVKAFTGVRYQLTRGDGSKSSGHKAVMEWSYMNDDAERNDFQGALADLYFFTGMKDTIEVQLPVGVWSLGYTGLFYYVSLPQAALDLLMEQADSLGNNGLNGNIEAVRWYLKAMKEAQGNDQKFAGLMARFGQAVMSSRTSFQTVLAAVGDLAKIQFKVEGQKFHSIDRLFDLNMPIP